MKNRLYIVIIPVLLIGTTWFQIVHGQSQYHKEIPRSDEQTVVVSLESAYGTVNIGSGTADKILTADMIIEPTLDMKTDIQYLRDNHRGVLNLILRPTEGQKRTWGIGSAEAGTWDLKFNKEIPSKFNIELGAGRGTFDFSGMHLTGLSLSTGASSVTVTFDEPNPGFIDVIAIESGVSRFTGENLGNANFGTLKFAGGVGSYTLDFDGELRHQANVNVELGIGAVTLIVPRHIGVKLYAAQRLFSSVNVPDDFERVNRNEYVSHNYEESEGRLVIRIESGFGSVRVRR